MLTSATKLFEKQGFAGTTLHEIEPRPGSGWPRSTSISFQTVDCDRAPGAGSSNMLARAQRIVERPHSESAKSMVALLSLTVIWAAQLGQRELFG